MQDTEPKKIPDFNKRTDYRVVQACSKYTHEYK